MMYDIISKFKTELIYRDTTSTDRARVLFKQIIFSRATKRVKTYTKGLISIRLLSR